MKRSKVWRVRKHYLPLSPEEAQTREDNFCRLLAQLILAQRTMKNAKRT